jgi:hypothetical protein
MPMRFTLSGAVSRLGKELRRLRLHLKPSADRTLTDLANLYGSDKGDLWFTSHGYTAVYEQCFASRRALPLTLMEIGLRHHPFYQVRSTTSPSLRMWLDYFPRALVCGFDINEFSDMGSSRVRIFRGDQGNADDLRKAISDVKAFDIIIDDGSHASWHQRVSLQTLFPALNPGGLYVIEDLSWQPEELERSLPKTELMTTLLKSDAFLRDLGLEAGDVRFFLNDKLAIIEKPSGAQRHG